MESQRLFMIGLHYKMNQVELVKTSKSRLVSKKSRQIKQQLNKNVFHNFFNELLILT